MLHWIAATLLLSPSPVRAIQTANHGQEPAPLLSPKELAELELMANAVLEEKLSPSFVIGVRRRGRSFVRGYGSAAPTGSKPDGSTLFEIGSVSKVFTGVLLADAHLRGEVDLDDALAEHAPAGCDVPQRGDTPIRLWHLATHTSGLDRMPPGYSPPDVNNPYADTTAANIWTALEAQRLTRAPLKRVEYSNFAVGLLGQVLAGPLASDYDKRLSQRITAPLGMHDTALHLTPERAARLAQGHDALGLPAGHWHFDVLGGAGGITSSVDDMLRFAQANLEPDPDGLGPALKLAQQARHAMEDAPLTLGLGWHINSNTGVLWHNGQTGGYHSFLALSPVHDLAVVALSASSDGTIEVIGNRLYQVLMSGDQAPPFELRRSHPVERSTLEKYVGEYQLTGAGTFLIELDEQGLLARLGAQPKFRLYPESTRRFFYRAVEAHISFEVEDGMVTALVLHQGGQNMRAQRNEH